MATSRVRQAFREEESDEGSPTPPPVQSQARVHSRRPDNPGGGDAALARVAGSQRPHLSGSSARPKQLSGTHLDDPSDLRPTTPPTGPSARGRQPDWQTAVLHVLDRSNLNEVRDGQQAAQQRVPASGPATSSAKVAAARKMNHSSSDEDEVIAGNSGSARNKEASGGSLELRPPATVVAAPHASRSSRLGTNSTVYGAPADATMSNSRLTSAAGRAPAGNGFAATAAAAFQGLTSDLQTAPVARQHQQHLQQRPFRHQRAPSNASVSSEASHAESLASSRTTLASSRLSATVQRVVARQRLMDSSSGEEEEEHMARKAGLQSVDSGSVATLTAMFSRAKSLPTPSAADIPQPSSATSGLEPAGALPGGPSHSSRKSPAAAVAVLASPKAKGTLPRRHVEGRQSFPLGDKERVPATAAEYSTFSFNAAHAGVAYGAGLNETISPRMRQVAAAASAEVAAVAASSMRPLPLTAITPAQLESPSRAWKSTTPVDSGVPVQPFPVTGPQLDCNGGFMGQEHTPPVVAAAARAQSPVNNSQRIASWLEQQPSLSAMSGAEESASEYATAGSGTEPDSRRNKGAAGRGGAYSLGGDGGPQGRASTDGYRGSRMHARAVRLTVSSDDDDQEAARRIDARGGRGASASSPQPEGRRATAVSPSVDHASTSRAFKDRASSTSSPSFRVQASMSADGSLAPSATRPLERAGAAATAAPPSGDAKPQPLLATSTTSPKRPSRHQPHQSSAARGEAADPSAQTTSGGGARPRMSPGSPGGRLTPKELRAMLSVLPRTGFAGSGAASASAAQGPASVSGESAQSVSYSDMLSFMRVMSHTGGYFAGLAMAPSSKESGGSIFSSRSGRDKAAPAPGASPAHRGSASAREVATGSASPRPPPPPRSARDSPGLQHRLQGPNAGASIGGSSSAMGEHPLAAPAMRNWSGSGSVAPGLGARAERQPPLQHPRDFAEMMRLWTEITGRQLATSAFVESLEEPGLPAEAGSIHASGLGSPPPHAASARSASPPPAAVLAASAAAMATSAVLAATAGGHHGFHAAYSQPFTHQDVLAATAAGCQPSLQQQQRQRSPSPAAAKARTAADSANLPSSRSSRMSPARAPAATAATASPARRAQPSQQPLDRATGAPGPQALDAAGLMRQLLGAVERKHSEQRQHQQRHQQQHAAQSESGSEGGGGRAADLTSMQTDLVRLIRLLSEAGHSDVLPHTVAVDAQTDLRHLVRLLSMAGSAKSDDSRSRTGQDRPTDAGDPAPALAITSTGASHLQAEKSDVPGKPADLRAAPEVAAIRAAMHTAATVPGSTAAGAPAEAASAFAAALEAAGVPSRRSSGDTIETGMALGRLYSALRDMRVRDEGHQTESPATASDGMQTEGGGVVQTVSGAVQTDGLGIVGEASNEVGSAMAQVEGAAATQAQPTDPSAGRELAAHAAMEGTAERRNAGADGSQAPVLRTSDTAGGIRVTRALKLPTGQLVELEPLLKLLSDDAAMEEATSGMDDGAGPAVQELRVLVGNLGGTALAPNEASLDHPLRLLSRSGSSSRILVAVGSGDAVAGSLRSLASSDVDGHVGPPPRRSDISAAASRTTIDGAVQTDLTAFDVAGALPLPPRPPAAHGKPRPVNTPSAGHSHSAEEGTSIATDSADGPGTSITAAPAVSPVAPTAAPGPATSPTAHNATAHGQPFGGTAFPLRNLPIASEGGLMDAPHQEAVSAGRVGSAGGMLAFLEAADPTTATALLELVQALQLMTLHSRRRRWVSDGSSTVSGSYLVEPPPGGFGMLGPENSEPIADPRCSFVTSIGPSVSQAGRASFTEMPEVMPEALEIPAEMAAPIGAKAVTVGGAAAPARSEPALHRRSQNAAAPLPPRPSAPADADPTAVHLRRALRAVSGGGNTRPTPAAGAGPGGRGGDSAARAAQPAVVAAPGRGVASVEAHIARALELLASGNTRHPSNPTAAAWAEEAELRAQEELVAALLALLTSAPASSAHLPATAAAPTAQAGTQPPGQAILEGPAAPQATLSQGQPLPAIAEQEQPAHEAAEDGKEDEPAPAASSSAADEDVAATAPESPSAALHARIQLVLQQAERASASISSLQVGLSPTRGDAAEFLDGVPFEQAIGFILDGLRDFEGGPAHLARHLHLVHPPSSGGAPSGSESSAGLRQSAVVAALEAAAAESGDAASRSFEAAQGVAEPAAGAVDGGSASSGGEVPVFSEEERQRVHTLVSAALAAAEAMALGVSIGAASGCYQESPPVVTVPNVAEPHAPEQSVTPEDTLPLTASVPPTSSPQSHVEPPAAPTAAQLPRPSLALAMASSRGNSPARLPRSAGSAPHGSSSNLGVTPTTAASRFSDQPFGLPTGLPIVLSSPGVAPDTGTLAANFAASASLDVSATGPEPSAEADNGSEVLAWLLPAREMARAAAGSQRSAPVTTAGTGPSSQGNTDLAGGAVACVPPGAAVSQTFGGALQLPEDRAVEAHALQQQQTSMPYLPYGNLDERLMPVDTCSSDLHGTTSGGSAAPHLPTFATPAAPAVRSATNLPKFPTEGGELLGYPPANGAGTAQEHAEAREADVEHSALSEQQQPEALAPAPPLVRSAPVTTAGDAQAQTGPARPAMTTGGIVAQPSATTDSASDPEVPALTAMDRFKGPASLSSSPYRTADSSTWIAPSADGKGSPTPSVRLARDAMTGQRGSRVDGASEAESVASVPRLHAQGSATNSVTKPSEEGARRALFPTEPASAAHAGTNAATGIAAADPNAAAETAAAPKDALLTQAAQLLLQAMQCAAEGQPEQQAALRLLSPVLTNLAAGKPAITEASMEGTAGIERPFVSASGRDQAAISESASHPGDGSSRSAQSQRLPLLQVEPEDQAVSESLPSLGPSLKPTSFTFENAAAAQAGTPTASGGAGGAVPSQSQAEAAVEAVPEGQQQQPHLATAADLENFKDDVMTSVRSALLEIVDMIGSTVVQQAAAAAATTAPGGGHAPASRVGDTTTETESDGGSSSGEADSVGSGTFPEAMSGAQTDEQALQLGGSRGQESDPQQQEIRITRAELEAFMFGKAVLSSSASGELLGVRLRDKYASQGGQRKSAAQRPPSQGGESSGATQSAPVDACEELELPLQDGDEAGLDNSFSLGPVDSEAGLVAPGRTGPSVSEPGATVPRDSPLRRPLSGGADFKSLFRRSMEHLRGHLQAQHPISAADSTSDSRRRSLSPSGGTAVSAGSRPHPAPLPDPRQAYNGPTNDTGYGLAETRLDPFEASLGPAVPPSRVQRAAFAAGGPTPARNFQDSAGADDDVELDPHLFRGRQLEHTTEMARWPDPAAPAAQLAKGGAAGARPVAAQESSEREAIGDFLAALAEPVVQVVGIFAQPAGVGMRPPFPQRSIIIEELTHEEPGGPDADQQLTQQPKQQNPEEQGWQLPARPSRVPGYTAPGMPGGVSWGDHDDPAGADVEEGDVNGVPRTRSAANTPRLRLRHPTVDSLAQVHISRSASATPVSRPTFTSTTAAPAVIDAAVGSSDTPVQVHSVAATPASRLKMTSAPGTSPLSDEDRPLSSFHGSSDLSSSVSPPRRRTLSPGQSRPKPVLPASASTRLDAPAPSRGSNVAAAALPTASGLRPVSGHSQANRSLEELESYLRDFKSKITTDHEQGPSLPQGALHPPPQQPGWGPEPREREASFGLGFAGEITARDQRIGAVQEGDEAVLPSRSLLQSFSNESDPNLADVTLGKSNSVLTGYNMFTIRASAASAMAAAAAVEQAFSPRTELERQRSAAAAAAAAAVAGARSGAPAGHVAFAPEPELLKAVQQQLAQVPVPMPAASTSRSSGGGSGRSGASGSAISRGSSSFATPTNPLLREHLEHFQALLEKANDLVDRLMLTDDDEAVSDGGAAYPSALTPSGRSMVAPLSTGGGASASGSGARRQLNFRLGPQHRSAAGALQQAALAAATPLLQAASPRRSAAAAGLTPSVATATATPASDAAATMATPGLGTDLLATPITTPSLDPELAALFPATAARLARPHALVEQSPDAANSLVSSALSALPQLAGGSAVAGNQAQSRGSDSASQSRSPAGSVGEISVVDHRRVSLPAMASVPSGEITAASPASASASTVAAAGGAVATPLALVAALLAEAHARMEFRSLEEQRGADRILSAVLDEHFAHVLGTPRGFLTPQRGQAGATAAGVYPSGAETTAPQMPLAALAQSPLPQPAQELPAPSAVHAAAAGGSNALGSAFDQAVVIAAAVEVEAREPASAVPFGLKTEAADPPAPSASWGTVTSEAAASVPGPAQQHLPGTDFVEAVAGQSRQPVADPRGAPQPIGPAGSQLPHPSFQQPAQPQLLLHAEAPPPIQQPISQAHVSPQVVAAEAELADSLSRMMQQRSALLSSALDQVQRVAPSSTGGSSAGGAPPLQPAAPPAHPPPQSATMSASNEDSTSHAALHAAEPMSAADLFAAAALAGGNLLPSALVPLPVIPGHFPSANPDAATTATANAAALAAAQLLEQQVMVPVVLPSLSVPATSGLQQPSPQPLMPYPDSESGRTSYNVSLAGSARHYYYNDSPAMSQGPSPRGSAVVLPEDAAAAAILARRLAAAASLNSRITPDPSVGGGVSMGGASALDATTSGKSLPTTAPFDLTHLIDDEDSGLSAGPSAVFRSSSGGSVLRASMQGAPLGFGALASPGAAAALLREAALRYNPVYDPDVPTSTSMGGAFGAVPAGGAAAAMPGFFDTPPTGGAEGISTPDRGLGGGALMKTLFHETAYTPLAEAASVAASDGGAIATSPLHSRLRSAGGTSTAVMVPNPAFEPHGEVLDSTATSAFGAPSGAAAAAAASAAVAGGGDHGSLSTLPSNVLSGPSSLSSVEVPGAPPSSAPSTEVQHERATLRLPHFDSTSSGSATPGLTTALQSGSTSVSGPAALPLSPISVVQAGTTAAPSSTPRSLAHSHGGASDFLLATADLGANSADLSSLLQSSLTESQLNLLAAAPELPNSRRQSQTATAPCITAPTAAGSSAAGSAAPAAAAVSVSAAMAAMASVPPAPSSEVGLMSVDFDEISREAAVLAKTLSHGSEHGQAPAPPAEAPVAAEMPAEVGATAVAGAVPSAIPASPALAGGSSATGTPRRPKSGGLVAAAVRLFESGSAADTTSATLPAPSNAAASTAPGEAPRSPKPVFKPASRAVSGIPRAPPSPAALQGGMSPAASRRNSDSSITEEQVQGAVGQGAAAPACAAGAVEAPASEVCAVAVGLPLQVPADSADAGAGMFASGSPSLASAAESQRPSAAHTIAEGALAFGGGNGAQGTAGPYHDGLGPPLAAATTSSEVLSDVELVDTVGTTFGVATAQAAAGDADAGAAGCDDEPAGCVTGPSSTVVTREWRPTASGEVPVSSVAQSGDGTVQGPPEVEPEQDRNPSPAPANRMGRLASSPGGRAGRSASPAHVRRAAAATTGGSAGSPARPRFVSSGSPGWSSSTRLTSTSAGSASTTPQRAQSGAAALALARANRHSSPAQSRIPSSLGGGSPGPASSGNHPASPTPAGRRATASPARTPTGARTTARSSTPGGRMISSALSGSIVEQTAVQTASPQPRSASVGTGRAGAAGGQGQGQVALHEAVRAYRNSRRSPQV